jgi:hypothetical protein
VLPQSPAPGIATVCELKVTSQLGESVQNHVHIDKCVSAIRAVQVPVFLQTLICLNDTSVATIQVGCCQGSPEILSGLCYLPSAAVASAAAAAAIGSANMDTWPLINSGCYHLTEIWFVRLRLNIVIKIKWFLWNYSRYTS